MRNVDIRDIKITDNSPEFIAAKNLAIEKVMEMIGIKAEGYAKLELTRSEAVDTGRLRNSITHSTKANTADFAYKWRKSSKGRGTPAGAGMTTSHGGEEDATVYLGTNVEYAPYVEFGTSKMEARPYLKPAFNDHLSEYKNMIFNELKGRYSSYMGG